ncbi:hypothetical protein VTK73DRAFT_7493 [Phialemonium thermophilum]|uniref:TPR domain protein n=1 Tax=Phialemonium thermophilum TaxID=223376 RepID=A0ABR3WEZ7_9PEZI
MGSQEAIPASAEYFDLGSHTFRVTTRSPDAQVWFDRGLIWSYGFNHEEAAFCFEQATLHDPECAMAYWGLAYAAGPNYNQPWSFFQGPQFEAVVQQTHKYVSQAASYAGTTSAVEKALINALQLRYPAEAAKPDAPWQIWNKDYARAMGAVYDEFPGNLDVAALYTDALLNMTPWQMWDIHTGKPNPEAETEEAQRVFDEALSLDGALRHPGLLHTYIHFIEMSPHPEAGLATADHLRLLVPDAAHLNHMPSHLDVLCGDYGRTVKSNMDAILADEHFAARRTGRYIWALYRAHNYHFRVYGAMLSGQSAVALDTAADLEKVLTEDLLRVEMPPLADYLESFFSLKLHALVRFGRWEDVIALELPKDQALYCATTAMTHYAKGVALAATGRVQEAEDERSKFQAALKNVLPSRRLFNNTCLDILAVAGDMLDGELEYRRGNYDVAFARLRDAIHREDHLPYDEPWGWMQPVRHALGALLLEQGRVEEAAAVYRADLGVDNSIPRPMQHPNNVWALHGYHECLQKLGRADEAREMEAQLEAALALADVPIQSSCFCRIKTCSSANKL